MEYHQQLLFPFASVRPGSRVVLYGAGDVGQTFYHQVAASEYCRVVAWVDRRWSGVRGLPSPFMSIDEMPHCAFDHVVIALSGNEACNAVAATLEGMGIPAGKLVMPHNGILHFNLCHPADAQPTEAESSASAFARLLCGATGIAWTDEASFSASQPVVAAPQQWEMAIVGTGFMAEIMANCVKRRLGNVCLRAVVSRNMQRARAFAERHGLHCAYDSCEALAGDSKVDLVHIATPVFLHHSQSLFFLNSGKHVLCEKPFALNERQAREMFAAAKRNNRVLVDGVWPRYLPLALKLQEILQSGIIGKVCTLTGNLYYAASDAARLNDISMGGGISLENGTYLMALASLVLGKDVRRVSAAGMLGGGNVDRQASITLLYDNALAVFTCGMDGVSDRQACIYGEKGFIVIDNANEYKVITVFDAASRPIERHAMQSGYEFEVRACVEAMEQNAQGHLAITTPHYSQEETLFAMRMLDEARRQMGVCYAEDLSDERA